MDEGWPASRHPLIDDFMADGDTRNAKDYLAQHQLSSRVEKWGDMGSGAGETEFPQGWDQVAKAIGVL